MNMRAQAHHTILNLLLAFILIACSNSARKDTLHVSFVATVAARESFKAWDKKHQDEIVANATSHEDGRTKLDAYREKRNAVLTMIVDTFQAIGAAQDANDDLSVTTALKLLADLKQAVDAFTKGVP